MSDERSMRKGMIQPERLVIVVGELPMEVPACVVVLMETQMHMCMFRFHSQIVAVHVT